MRREVWELFEKVIEQTDYACWWFRRELIKELDPSLFDDCPKPEAKPRPFYMPEPRDEKGTATMLIFQWLPAMRAERIKACAWRETQRGLYREAATISPTNARKGWF